MEKMQKLIDILMTHRNDDPSKFRENEKTFLASLDSHDLAIAQQSMIEAGMDMDVLVRMWNRNKSILPDQMAKMRAELPDEHILQIVIAEHQMILCFMTDLVSVNKEIQKLEDGNSSTNEIRKLAHITTHLASSEQHREREEHLILPELIKNGYSGLITTIDRQHQAINNLNYNLNQLVWSVDKIKFDNFKAELDSIVETIVPMMRLHIFIESNIVFPLALEVISDQKTWDRMKELADQIGYCGYD